MWQRWKVGMGYKLKDRDDDVKRSLFSTSDIPEFQRAELKTVG